MSVFNVTFNAQQKIEYMFNEDIEADSVEKAIITAKEIFETDCSPYDDGWQEPEITSEIRVKEL